MKTKLLLQTLKYGRKYGLLLIKNKGKIISGLYAAKEIIEGAIDVGKHVTKAVKKGYQEPAKEKEPSPKDQTTRPPKFVLLRDYEYTRVCAECVTQITDPTVREAATIARLGESCLMCHRKVDNFGHPTTP